MSMNHQIITLENNEKYFVLEEILDNKEEYYLMLNIGKDNEIKIVSKDVLDNKIILIDVEDDKLLTSLSIRFKELLEKDQEIYS